MAEDTLVVLVFDPNSPPSDDVFLVFGFAVLPLVPLLVALFLRLAVVVSYKLGMGLYFTRPSRKLLIVMSTFLVVTGYCMCEGECVRVCARKGERASYIIIEIASSPGSPIFLSCASKKIREPGDFDEASVEM